MSGRKRCHACGGRGPFTKSKNAPDGLDPYCRKCKSKRWRPYYRKNKKRLIQISRRWKKANRERAARTSRAWALANPCKVMLREARRRAKKSKVRFTIAADDIFIPTRCPLLGNVLKRGVGTHTGNSPSLDRRDPKKGYTPDNVWVISRRANVIKQDATLEELEQLVRNLRKTVRVR